MNPTILWVVGPGFLNQVPTLFERRDPLGLLHQQSYNLSTGSLMSTSWVLSPLCNS